VHDILIREGSGKYRGGNVKLLVLEEYDRRPGAWYLSNKLLLPV